MNDLVDFLKRNFLIVLSVVSLIAIIVACVLSFSFTFAVFFMVVGGSLVSPFIKGKLQGAELSELWKNYWTDGQVIPIGTIFFMTYLIVFGFFWELQTWIFSFLFFGIAIALGLIGAGMKGDGKFKYKLATFSLKFCVFVIICGILTTKTSWGKTIRNYVFNGGNLTSEVATQPQTQTTSSAVPAPRLPPAHNLEDEEQPVANKVREVLKRQPDLLQTCINESGLRQHKMVDGKFDPKQVLKGVNNDGTESTSIGVCMINVPVWKSLCVEELKLDLENGVDNAKCALAVYKKVGLDAWHTDPRSPNILIFNIPVEGEGWTNHFIFPKNVWSSIHKEENIFVQKDDDEPFLDGPTMDKYYGIPKSLAFKMAEKPTKIQITYKWPDYF
jgi:hypothetical protein